jgi:hypothetical protein
VPEQNKNSDGMCEGTYELLGFVWSTIDLIYMSICFKV